MPNRLAQEKSPYLLQHADNPVDWHPWGEEAFRRAREEDKPVLLSIGYATCHWCHVMAHESFEDEEVARALNRDFIAVKVDREERPDVDSVYMQVCQALTGAGGWPLTVFLTPDKKPFFAGTYFPKASAYGRPGFLDVLAAIVQTWRNQREKITGAGDQITRALRQRPQAGEAELSEQTLEKGYWQLAKSFDPKQGGFGAAPKFPTPHHLTFLLRWHLRQPTSRAREMAERTLTAMRMGGLFDHVGWGFHRYSVDAQWLVPHFEKMLYDQAQLAYAFLEAFQLTGQELYQRTAREVIGYVLRDLTSPEGAFYSAEDADSEGVEGKFYVWTPAEVKQVLGEELGGLFCSHYGLTPEGNFEHGLSIPHEREPVEAVAARRGLETGEAERLLAEARRQLFAAREKRVRPLTDDKVLTAWNGLMIAALAKSAQALGEGEHLAAAQRAADFVLAELTDDKGRLLRRWREGQTLGPGYLDDYAFFLWGLIELYEAGFEPRRLEEALALARQMHELFWDDVGKGFFYTPHHAEDLIVREKDLYDGATPSGNSTAAWCLLRLARLTGDTAWEKRAGELMRAFSAQVDQTPMAYTQLLMALDFAQGPSREVVVAGPAEAGAPELMAAAQRAFLPRRALVLKPDGPRGEALAELAPYVREMGPVEGRAAAYVCQGFACQAPVTGVEELREALA
jgi:hypothetical protein